jgi:hypothetical protein
MPEVADNAAVDPAEMVAVRLGAQIVFYLREVLIGQITTERDRARECYTAGVSFGDKLGQLALGIPLRAFDRLAPLYRLAFRREPRQHPEPPYTNTPLGHRPFMTERGSTF